MIFGLRLAQLLAQLVERRLVLLERLEAGARLQRLRREALERLLVLLQLAVGRGQPRRVLLGLRDGIGQRLDARVDRLELRRALRRLLQPSVTSSSRVFALPAFSSTSCSDLLAVASFELSNTKVER